MPIQPLPDVSVRPIGTGLIAAAKRSSGQASPPPQGRPPNLPQVVPVAILSGPVGVGKTATALALGEVLEERGIAHSVVDLDMLTYTYPRSPDDPFGNELAVANLRCVWRNSHSHGSHNLVIARVVEEQADVDAIAAAVAGAAVTVVRLEAPVEVLQSRLQSRETGASLRWHLNRAEKLARTLTQSGPADIVLDTSDTSVFELADRIADQTEGILQRHGSGI